jgi:ELWxxDGT repeat protein
MVEIPQPYRRDPAATADAVYFTSNGGQLWKYDLNSVTPILIAYRPNPGYSAQLLRAIGKTLYFLYTSSTGGNELWKTDGSPEGTTKVTAVPSAFGIQSTIAYAGELFFSVDDGIHGRELWRSDGTEAGTRMVKDIAVGSGAALDDDPEFRILQSKLYFHASTDDAGMQLYVYDASTAAPPVIGPVSTTGVNHYDASFMVTIDASGVATRAALEYGETTAYGFAAPIALTPSNGISDQILPAAISGLKPGTTYHYRVTAVNAGGTTSGAEGSFTTLATQPPLWNGFAFDAYYQAQKSIPIAALLANASDPDGDALSITAVSAGSQGGSMVLAGDFIQYTPAKGFQGAETFQITLSDFPNGGTTATVTANVSGPFGNSHLPAEIISTPGGLKTVRFHAIPGRTYRMERSFDLKTWALIARPTADIDGIAKSNDQTSPTGSAFYRLAYP